MAVPDGASVLPASIVFPLEEVKVFKSQVTAISMAPIEDEDYVIGHEISFEDKDGQEINIHLDDDTLDGLINVLTEYVSELDED